MSEISDYSSISQLHVHILGSPHLVNSFCLQYPSFIFIYPDMGPKEPISQRSSHHTGLSNEPFIHQSLDIQHILRPSFFSPFSPSSSSPLSSSQSPYITHPRVSHLYTCHISSEASHPSNNLIFKTIPLPFVV